ncbi:MAG: hypothetical protein A2854_04130 [Parcubacteria group bacterium RIFCSPHIGHO2_01_FULL_56_18]|nr:MAG: hypothetical protein A2854_04130 [Parcubacteria group bacterium RIFCSPHIGHO2_01_FULL_56_18]
MPDFENMPRSSRMERIPDYTPDVKELKDIGKQLDSPGQEPEKVLTNLVAKVRAWSEKYTAMGNREYKGPSYAQSLIEMIDGIEAKKSNEENEIFRDVGKILDGIKDIVHNSPKRGGYL